MKALIYCAGEGTRFQPYTLKTPKPCIPFLGFPMFYYSAFQLHCMGVTDLVYNSFHLSEQVIMEFNKENVKSKFNSIHNSNESSFSYPLNSGGGLFYAKKYLESESHFIVCNGDEIIIPRESKLAFQNYYNTFKNNKPFALLLTTNHPEAGKKFGAVWVDANNKIIGFGKTPPQSSPTNLQSGQSQTIRPLHFLGTQIFSSSIYKYLEKANSKNIYSNILYDVVQEAINCGESVYAYNIDCTWEETGNLTDYLKATQESLDLLTKKNNYLGSFFEFWSNNQNIKKNSMASDNISQNLDSIGDFYLKSNSTANQIIFFHKTNFEKINDIESASSGFLILGEQSNISKNTSLQNVVVGNNQTITSSQRDTLII